MQNLNDLADLMTGSRGCCNFVRRALVAQYGEERVSRAPVQLWHLWPEWKDPDGPVTAVVQAELGERVADFHPRAWHVVQIWRGVPFAPGVSGHTFLARPKLGVTSANTVVQVLESTETAGPRARWVEWPRFVKLEGVQRLAIARLVP